jgi:hypothetical protein
MRPRTLLLGVALGRLAIGVALVVRPDGPMGAGWVGEAEARRPGPALLIRAIGARDVALALGTVAARRTGASLRPWLLGASLADAADLLGTLAAGRAVPRSGRLGVPLLAGGAIAAQIAVLRAID